MKRVLVIGSKGNLGKDLVKVFEDDINWEVFGYDKEDIDITSEQSLREKIDGIEPTAVVNAAAYNAVDKCETDEAEYELAKKINGYGPGYLAKICKEKGISLTHYVSDYIFDGKKGEYVENDQPNPINNYGRSKYLGEQKVRENTDKFYLVRTSKLFGTPGNSSAAKPNFFDIMIRLSKNNDILKVVDDEKSCFTYTPDLALETKKMIDEQISFGIYHVVNEGPCTWYEAVKELFKLSGISVKVIPVSSSEFPRPARRPKSSVLLNTKLKPLRHYTEALKEYLKAEHPELMNSGK